ncbi:UvrD-helicase domain-containing protein [Bifidobacterium leontopitheci]|uniref:DNA 3'-5' helicase n=1 Tax=Bifidobacterium leontopitheci TaxID=2650774 RepID=A0A6I1GKS5_9BIFI|nr:UvrD-helicase domain-containing protein [Bifidobacterium leontopitheci]KAB7790049.1 UvrD/REP helicase N-terminal domain-containing protein [Bifidobacterium leontopitheci]
MKNTTSKDNRYFISASAGTGKTTQLLQDVMLDLLNPNHSNHTSIRESLIITFTTAAAAELRAKLDRNLRFAVDYARSCQSSSGERPHDVNYYIGGDDGPLARMIASDPERAAVVFARAVNELPSTQISTIDALNKHIVDRNADALGIDPGYQILADEAIRSGMQQKVIGKLFEQWYDPADPEHDDFMDLLDNTGGARHDDALAQEILALYDQCQTKPNGIAWLDGMSSLYRIRFTQQKPLKGANAFVDGFVHEWHDTLEKLRQKTAVFLAKVNTTSVSSGDKMKLVEDSRTFGRVFKAADEVYERYCKGSWDDVRDALDAAAAEIRSVNNGHDNPSSANLNALDDLFADIGMKSDENKDAIKLLKQVQQHINRQSSPTKTDFLTLRDLFALSAEQMDRLDDVAQRRLDTLRRAVKRFAHDYDAAKNDAALQDYADIAHLALRALERHDDVLRRINERWRYVYVDECQDNNALQNRFIDLIGQGADKVTMVGDVKQSIYGFRHAQPEEFRRKSREVAPEHQSALTQNHRSVPEILMFVNTVFDHLMSEGMGGADYLQDRFQIAADGPTHAYDPHSVELLIRAKQTDGEETDETPSPRGSADQQQVDMIVRRIRRLHDEEQYRYSDIAVLERSTKLFAQLHDAMVEAGIPVEVNGVGDYYHTPEIVIALDWLRAIDNPHRDVPLVAVMRAHGIPDNDLATIRLLGKGSFYTLLQRLVHPSERHPLPSPLPGNLGDDEHLEALRSFLDTLESFRSYAATHTVDELLWHVYQQTGWYDYCGLLPNGRQRQANLAQLCVKARTVKDTGEHGLHAFLDAVEQWAANDSKDVNAEASTQQSKDAVHVTTIHKAKGLQWKAVILADATSNAFNAQNLSAYVTVQDPEDAGRCITACNIHDERLQTTVKTLQYAQQVSVAKRQSIEEQLRLLYVAMTRPERKLIIAGIVDKEPEQLLETTAVTATDDGMVSPDDIVESGTYMTWILQALWAASAHTSSNKETSDTDKCTSAGFGTLSAPISNDNGVLEYVMPLPDGLKPDTVTGNAEGRRFVIAVDNNDVPEQTLASASSHDAVMQRPSPNGFKTVGQRTLDDERIPVTINASGIRRWAETTAADTEDESGITSVEPTSPDSGSVSSSEQYAWRRLSYPLPDFLSDRQQQPSAAEIGTAVHNVLEQFDWSVPASKSECEHELRTVIRRLEDVRIISPQTACAVENGSLFDGMMWFVCGGQDTDDENGNSLDSNDSQNAAGLVSAIRSHRDRLYREAPFSMLMDKLELESLAIAGTQRDTSARAANRCVQEPAEDGIVVRGIIDAYYVDEESRSIVLLDYKTDAVLAEERDDLGTWHRRLRTEYWGQQALYAKALEQLYPGYTVTQRWLVGLAGRQFIDMCR